MPRRCDDGQLMTMPWTDAASPGQCPTLSTVAHRPVSLPLPWSPAGLLTPGGYQRSTSPTAATLPQRIRCCTRGGGTLCVCNVAGAAGLKSNATIQLRTTWRMWRDTAAIVPCGAVSALGKASTRGDTPTPCVTLST